jgi:hypothetical protein
MEFEAETAHFSDDVGKARELFKGINCEFGYLIQLGSAIRGNYGKLCKALIAHFVPGNARHLMELLEPKPTTVDTDEESRRIVSQYYRGRGFQEPREKQQDEQVAGIEEQSLKRRACSRATWGLSDPDPNAMNQQPNANECSSFDIPGNLRGRLAPPLNISPPEKFRPNYSQLASVVGNAERFELSDAERKANRERRFGNVRQEVGRFTQSASESPMNDTEFGRTRNDYYYNRNQPASNELFIEELPEGISTEQVAEMFCEFGNVMAVRIKPNKYGTLVGWVDMETVDEARCAKDGLKNVIVGKVPLIVVFARQRDPKPGQRTMKALDKPELSFGVGSEPASLKRFRYFDSPQ